MKIQLIGRNVAAGNPFETGGKYISDLISSALYSGNKTKQEEYISYEDSLNRSVSGTKGDQNRNLGVLEQLVQGSLGKRDYIIRSSKNASLSMQLHGTGVGSLASIGNNIIDKTPLSIALEAGLAPVVDQQHITIGNQRISSGALDTILYNGGDVLNIWAPVNANGDVDLDKLQTLSAVQEICDSNPNLTVQDKNNLLQKYNLDGQYDENGVYHGNGNMAQFLVMTGLTSEKVIDDDLNPYVDRLSSDEKKDAFAQIERIYGQINKGVKSGKYEFKTGLFNAFTDLYTAPIFMKLNNTAQIDIGTFSGKGPRVKTPTYQEQMAYDQMRYINEHTNVRQPLTEALF